jgi:hypothetical protein
MPVFLEQLDEALESFAGKVNLGLAPANILIIIMAMQCADDGGAWPKSSEYFTRGALCADEIGPVAREPARHCAPFASQLRMRRQEWRDQLLEL